MRWPIIISRDAACAPISDRSGRGTQETGSGTGLGIEVRGYPVQAMNGFWLGVGAAGFPAAEWECEDESGRGTAWDVHVTMGWTIRIDRNFAITPYFTAGNVFSDSPRTGAYAGPGLTFSIGW